MTNTRMPPARRRMILSVVGLGAVVAAGAQMLARTGTPAVVQAEAARPHAISNSIIASGAMAYESQLTLGTEVLGRVEEVLVREGDRVTRGQVVARLDAESVRAELDQLKANHAQALLSVKRQRVDLKAAVARLQRNKELRRLGMIEATKFDDLLTQQEIAEVELHKAEKGVAQAEAQIEQIRQRLARTSISAPIDGRVVQISIRPGETAVPSAMSIAGGALMVIADTRRLFVDVGVDEADIERIVVGQRASVTTAAAPQRPLLGRVDSRAPIPRSGAGVGQGFAQGANRSYAVRILLEARDEESFHHGMSARAEIDVGTSRNEVLAVPVQAVVYEDSPDVPGSALAWLFVVRDGRALRRPVTTGSADDMHIEIKQGLAAGELVVVGPAQVLRLLHDGAVVRVESPHAPEAGQDALRQDVR